MRSDKMDFNIAFLMENGFHKAYRKHEGRYPSVVFLDHPKNILFSHSIRRNMSKIKSLKKWVSMLAHEWFSCYSSCVFFWGTWWFISGTYGRWEPWCGYLFSTFVFFTLVFKLFFVGMTRIMSVVIDYWRSYWRKGSR